MLPALLPLVDPGFPNAGSEGGHMAKVRITVVKRAFHQDLVDRHADKAKFLGMCSACQRFEEGQSFVIEAFPTKPADFPCDWAWVDIQRDVAVILFGGDLPWMAKPGTAMPCCSDGFRPVSFLIERLED
jgi:uncharacterized repeat protein (TIGR04076 family)